MRPLLAAATHAVDLAAPVPVHEVGEPVSRRRLLSHSSWWPVGRTSWEADRREREGGMFNSSRPAPAVETPVLP
jgi:hypothetical protein